MLSERYLRHYTSSGPGTAASKKGDRFIFLSEETQTMDNSNNTLPGWDAIVQTMQAVMVLTGAGSAENKSPFTIRVAGQGPGDG
jgi:hypothetical protein